MLKQAANEHADIGASLDVWYRAAKGAAWGSLEEMREIYPKADRAGPYTVFNIKGNSYRLIVKIEYKYQKIFIKHVLTHAEYDKGDWK